MRNNAKIVECQRRRLSEKDYSADLHEMYSEQNSGSSYPYDADLWGECPLCWLTDGAESRRAALKLAGSEDPYGEDEAMARERFKLQVQPGDLVEVWSAIPNFSVAVQNALAAISGAKPSEYEGPKHAFDAVVEACVLTPCRGEGRILEYDPGQELLIVRRLTGGRFFCNRFPWPPDRMEFSGPFPEDEEFELVALPEGAMTRGVPAEDMWSFGQGQPVRIYKKEMSKQ